MLVCCRPECSNQVRHNISGTDLLKPVQPAKEVLERLFHLLEDAKFFHGGLLLVGNCGSLSLFECRRLEKGIMVNK